MPAAAFWAFYRGGERRGAILTVHSLEFMSAVIADKFCHSSKHKLFLSRLDYCPNRPPACGYCIPDDRFGFGRAKVLISCDLYKSIMVHGLQIHFNFSVFPIVVMLLFLFYGCKDTTKLCQTVAWQRRKETLFPNLSCIKDKTIPLGNGRQSLKNGHGACPCWARCLPQVGNVLAPVGHDLYPFCGYLEWLEEPAGHPYCSPYYQVNQQTYNGYKHCRGKCFLSHFADDLLVVLYITGD